MKNTMKKATLGTFVVCSFLATRPVLSADCSADFPNVHGSSLELSKLVRKFNTMEDVATYTDLTTHLTFHTKDPITETELSILKNPSIRGERIIGVTQEEDKVTQELLSPDSCQYSVGDINFTLVKETPILQ